MNVGIILKRLKFGRDYICENFHLAAVYISDAESFYNNYLMDKDMLLLDDCLSKILCARECLYVFPIGKSKYNHMIEEEIGKEIMEDVFHRMNELSESLHNEFVYRKVPLANRL